MLKGELWGSPRRFIASFAAVVIMMCGTAIVTLSQLGTAPVSSPVYAMTLIGGLSFGGWTFTLNLLLIMAQLVLLRSRFARTNWLQIPALVLASVTLDLWMEALGWLRTDNYLAQWGVMILGILILGFGVSILATANTIFLPGEGFVAAIALLRQTPFPQVKIAFDVFCVTSALILSVLFVHHLEAVCEATVVSALTLGIVVGFFLPAARKIVGPEV